MQDVPSAVLQPTEVIPAKRFLSAKKSVICDVRMEEFTLKKLPALFLALLLQRMPIRRKSHFVWSLL